MLKSPATLAIPLALGVAPADAVNPKRVNYKAFGRRGGQNAFCCPSCGYPGAAIHV